MREAHSDRYLLVRPFNAQSLRRKASQHYARSQRQVRFNKLAFVKCIAGPLAKEIARQEAVKVKALKKKMVEVQEEKEVLQRVMEEEDKERVQRESELQVERGNLTLKVVAAAIQIQRCWRGHFLRKRVIRPYVDLRSWQLRQMTANILLAPVDNVLEALNQFKAQLEKVTRCKTL